MLLAAAGISGGGGGTPDAYAQAVLADTPALYLRLNESSGPTAKDSSGNGRHGTYQGTLSLGQTGLALTDDACVRSVAAGDGYVQTPALTGVDIKAIEMWLQFTDVSTYRPLFSLLAADESKSITVYWHFFDQKVAVWQYGGANDNIYYSDLSPWSPTGKLHIAFFYNSTDDKTYCMVNRTVQASVFDGNFFADYTGGTLFAGGDNDRGSIVDAIPGYIDEVAVYGQEVSEERFIAHFNATDPGAGPWPLTGVVFNAWGGAEGGGAEQPYTLSEALAAAHDGDLIILHPAIYSAYYDQYLALDKLVHVRGVPTSMAPASIDVNFNNSTHPKFLVSLNTQLSARLYLEGFKLTNDASSNQQNNGGINLNCNAPNVDLFVRKGRLYSAAATAFNNLVEGSSMTALKSLQFEYCHWDYNLSNPTAYKAYLLSNKTGEIMFRKNYMQGGWNCYTCNGPNITESDIVTSITEGYGCEAGDFILPSS